MAKEYMDREVLLKNLNRFAQDNYCVTINDVIINLPAADVAKVVRCENCQYYELLGDAILTDVVHGICTYRPVPCGVKNNDFCSYGERKGDVKSDGMDQRKR